MRDKVWFTYKARIRTHERLVSNDFHSQVILVWYALASTFVSIASIRYPKLLGEDTDVFSASLSVMLLAVSMLVTGRDFRGRAIEICKNYRALGSLYNSLGTAPASAEQALKYDELLNSVENHSEMDDLRARYANRKNLTSRQPTPLEIATLATYLTVRATIITALYVLPLLFVPHLST